MLRKYTLKKQFLGLCCAMLAVLCALVCRALLYEAPTAKVVWSKAGLTDEDIEFLVDKICSNRNQAILDGDAEAIKVFYDTGVRNGLYAYEHEIKKMKYLQNWSEKQCVEFTSIDSASEIKWTRLDGDCYTVNMLVSTTYKYVYKDRPKDTNTMRIGTYHEMVLTNYDSDYLITREWYTDPFADSLELESLKTDKIESEILSRESRAFPSLHASRCSAVDYADKYVGAADSGANNYKYNPDYKNYNPQGGDCANFVSQILYEAGKFKKNRTWNYDKDGSRAWVNAGSLTNYMLNSGRASLIIKGSYEEALALSYELLPGDIIVYEIKGDIKHVSMVTGADSRGYALVNCHNTDRYRVPWDLGWSNERIKFYLLRVNY